VCCLAFAGRILVFPFLVPFLLVLVMKLILHVVWLKFAHLCGLFVHFGWLACVLLLDGSCDPCLATGLYQYWLVAVLMCEILACWIMLCLAPPPVLFLICTSTDWLILYDYACPDCSVELLFSLCYPNFDLMSLAVWVVLNGLLGRLVLDLVE
jgi:hypothetical protein